MFYCDNINKHTNVHMSCLCNVNDSNDVGFVIVLVFASQITCSCGFGSKTVSAGAGRLAGGLAGVWQL